MSFLFGRSSSTNDHLVREQQRQASEAERKAIDLKARREGAQSEISGIFGGIGNDFLENYRNAHLSYYTPQLADQYDEAKQNVFYDYARKGTARSTSYQDTMAKLEKERQAQLADVNLTAEQQAENLRSRIESERTSAMELASISEDPTMAVNRALTEVNAIQNQKPDVSPLGDIFSVAAMGYNANQQANLYKKYLGQVPQTSPYGRNGAARNVT